MQDNEIWKPVLNLEHNYLISESGFLKRISKQKGTYEGRLLSPALDIKGYAVTRLRYETGYRKVRIHRLVAEAFHANPDNLPQVNHKDGNKSNNHFSNLEWITNEHNLKHAWQNGLMPQQGFYKNKTGSAHNRSVTIKCINIDTGEEKIIIGINEVCRQLKTTGPAVWRVLTGKFKHSKRWRFSRIQTFRVQED